MGESLQGKTASGEILDTNKLVAAHRHTNGTVVTNLENQRAVEVRIID